MSVNRLLPLVLILLSAQAYSQNQFSGKVYDKASNKPVRNVTVYVEDLKTGAVSNSDGRYALPQLPEGTYMVGVHCL